MMGDEWTAEDTRALRVDMVCRHCGTSRADAEAAPRAACNHPRFVNAASALECRAADEIERLQARVREPEANNGALQAHVAMRTEILAMAERADTIPRAVLVSALRERAITWTDVGEDGEETFSSDCSARRAWELRDVADEIERGEWPRSR